MRRLLNQLNFYIMPVFNVDGYHFSWTTVTYCTLSHQHQTEALNVMWRELKQLKQFKWSVKYRKEKLPSQPTDLVKYESCVQVDQMLQQKWKGSMQTHYAALWSVKVHM